MECSKSQWRTEMEGSRPGLLAPAILARLAEGPAGNNGHKPPETVASSVLFPSSAMDRLVAARLQVTVVCHDWLCADVLQGGCEQQPVMIQSYL